MLHHATEWSSEPASCSPSMPRLVLDLGVEREGVVLCGRLENVAASGKGGKERHDRGIREREKRGGGSEANGTER